MSLRKKLVYSVDAPFAPNQWPNIPHDVEEAILELLCSLTAPIGQYHQNKHSSKGKRAKKRKRAQGEESEEAFSETSSPPAPHIASFVDVGLACITRELQADSRKTPGAEAEPVSVEKTPYALIFVAHSGQPAAFYNHFPELVATTTRSGSDYTHTRLVGYSRSCSERLSASLGIPRVSSIAIRHGAPGSKALVEYAQSQVPPVSISWLQQVQTGKYLPSKVITEEKSVAVKKGSKP